MQRIPAYHCSKKPELRLTLSNLEQIQLMTDSITHEPGESAEAVPRRCAPTRALGNRRSDSFSWIWPIRGVNEVCARRRSALPVTQLQSSKAMKPKSMCGCMWQ